MILALMAASLSFVLFLVGRAFFRNRRALGASLGLLLAALLLTLAALSATLSVSTQGYRALTREEIVVLVATEPAGHQRFSARFVFPDGREETFALSGDELYVDAHILKWKPLINLLGLHTSYELDRVAGRYSELEDERDETRTIYSVAASKPFDLFNLRRRYGLLFAPFVDTEYGSATFVEVHEAAELEVRVSTTGLLIRERPESSG
jgi:hypothetical protein